MPAYLPTTDSQRSIGLLTMAWTVRRWTPTTSIAAGSGPRASSVAGSAKAGRG